MEFQPENGQDLLIESIKENPRLLVQADMGFGKTVATLTAINDIGIFPVVIVAPLLVADDTWPSEVKKWDHLKHLTIVSLCGGKKNFKENITKKADIYTINFANVNYLLGYKIKWLIVDECSKLKGFRTRQGAKRPKSMYKIAKCAERFTGLSGTMIPNGYIDLWGQMFFVDHGLSLGGSFTAFTNEFFNKRSVGAHVGAVKYDLIESSERIIRERIKDKVVTLRAEDYFPVDKPVIINVEFSLTPDVENHYKTMVKKLCVELASTDILAANAAVKSMKLLQITSGSIMDEYKVVHDLHDLKLQKLDSIIEECNGQPIIVSYHFRSEAQMILKRYKKAVQLGKDKSTIKKWNEGKISILLVHPSSAGHGLNLQYGGHRIVFFTCWWNLEEHLQIIERIGPLRQKKAGFKRPVYIYRIIAKNTIDESVINRLEGKATVQDAFKLELARYTKEGDQCGD